MFIAPVAKSTELAKTIAKNTELSTSIVEKLHTYARYDARNVAFPAIKNLEKEAEYFSPSTPTMQPTAKVAESVGKILDVIAS